MHRQCVVEILHPLLDRQCVVHRDEQQNLDAPNLDEIQSFLDVARLANPAAAVVGVEPHPLLKMDCCQVVVGVELHPLLKMDYYPDVVPVQLELELRVLHFLLLAVLIQIWPLHA